MEKLQLKEYLNLAKAIAIARSYQQDKNQREEINENSDVVTRKTQKTKQPGGKNYPQNPESVPSSSLTTA